MVITLFFSCVLHSFHIQFPIGFHDDDRRDDKSQDVRHRHGIQHAVQAEEHRQQQGKAHAEHHLTEHGQQRGGQRLADCLQKDETRLVDAGEDHHAQIRAERLDGKRGVVAALVGCAENGDELPGKALCQHERHRADQRLSHQQSGEQIAHAQRLARAHVVAHDGDAARRHADHDGDDDLEELHHDADHRHGDLRVLCLPEHGVERAVFAQHIVDGRHRRHEADLGQEARDTQRQHPAADAAAQGKVGLGRADDLHVQQIPHGEQRRRHLTDDRGHRRTHHAPFEYEDKNRVEDDVDNSAYQCGDHGELGIAVGADDGVHGLPEHIKQDAQRDIEEVLLRVAEGLLVHRAAEHGDDPVCKNEIYRRQNETAGNAQHHRVADTALGLVRLVSAQRHADKGAAAVADHDGDGQCHDGQREHDRIGRVAV